MSWTPKPIDQYPKNIIGDRERSEGQFIACLYNDPDLFHDYPLEPSRDLFSSDARYFYRLGQRMLESGYHIFDEISIGDIVESDPVFSNSFEAHGGYSGMAELRQLVSNENIDAHYDAILKSNMLCRIYDEISSAKSDISAINRMSSEQLYDYLDYKLGEIAVDESKTLQVENISKGYDKYIEEWDKGRSVGIEVGFPMLNYRMVGIHPGSLVLHLTTIGNGKTTSAILFYLLPAIKSGHDCLIVANEQSLDEWRQMILSTVLFNCVHTDTHMTRHSLLVGGFDDQEKENLHIAAEWLENQKGQIYFAELPDYNIRSAGKLVKKYSRLGVKLCLVDTFKPEREDADRAWADLSEAAKNLFQVAKRENCAIIATAQLASSAMRQRYLDLSCVGKSRAISETATQVIMFRNMTEQEKDKLKVYKYDTDQETGKKTKIQVELQFDKNYIILFTPKNRYGETTPQLVYERNMNFNSMREIGYTEVPFDFDT